MFKLTQMIEELSFNNRLADHERTEIIALVYDYAASCIETNKSDDCQLCGGGGAPSGCMLCGVRGMGG